VTNYITTYPSPVPLLPLVLWWDSLIEGCCYQGSYWTKVSSWSSWSHRASLVTNPAISHKWGNDREVFTTSGTYPWLFVKQIFHRGQPSRGGDHNIFEVMTSTLPNVFIKTLPENLVVYYKQVYQGLILNYYIITGVYLLVRPALYIAKQGALDSQPQVIKITSCLPMVVYVIDMMLF
jgi:hypothetical protein